MNKYSLVWELNSLFPNQNQFDQIKSKILLLNKKLDELKKKSLDSLQDQKTAIIYLQQLSGQCRDLSYFIDCLLSENVNNEEALLLQGNMTILSAACETVEEGIYAKLSELEVARLNELMDDRTIQPIAFFLNEKIRVLRDKLPIEQERLVHQLGIDGYQGWNEIYQTFLGDLRIPSPLTTEVVSVGQAENCLLDSRKSVRDAWFLQWKKTWRENENLVAQIINHLGGFRIHLYQARGWPSIIKEPLFLNRMKEKTLLTMWQTVDEFKPKLQKYLKHKAQLMGLEQLSWVDVDAPIKSKTTQIDFQEAAEFIIRHFSEFSPSLGKFAKSVFENKWIEAENRTGKRPGGFCAPFSEARQSRIFMTYNGSMNNMMTLAHELGHAYHSYELRQQPFFSQCYPMNLAETASTLAEAVITDSLLKECQDQSLKVELLDNKLQRAVVFLMNIRARFSFEMNFYEERKKGFLLAKDLNNLMEQAQKSAYGNELSEWNPHFWASKQHFFITETPFYNFPYTVGYLFSQGIYSRMKKNHDRKETYASLLQDTGRMTLEQLAEKHLGANLEEPQFWKESLNLVEKDLNDYLKLR